MEIISIACVVIGLIFIAVYLFIRNKMNNCYESTTAKVINYIRFNKDEIEYTVEGNVYKKQTILQENVSHPKTGEEFTIFYNPKNPKEFVREYLLILYRKASKILLICGITLLIMAILFLLLFL